ncbi:unnamed protein product [marine sediment metagenome]|uniref:Nitroreductase domain-containing protein n=1 Tax=marine sediment metagenome TaxID=412755 RepID=X1HHX9_9ZZZZ
MSDKRVKTLTLALKISITFLVLVALLISLISCNGLREVSSYITHTIKEKSKDNAGEEEDKTKNNMRGEEIMLTQPELESNISLEEALNSRRSVRNFSSKELSLNQISQILWAAQGITQESTGFRTSPSAGALYPLEIFLLKSDGVFHYIPDGHKIIKLNPDDLRPDLIQGVLFQGFVADAPVNIIITAVYERTTAKYGNRGIRYVHLEAGHSCQNILLQAV